MLLWHMQSSRLWRVLSADDDAYRLVKHERIVYYGLRLYQVLHFAVFQVRIPSSRCIRILRTIKLSLVTPSI